MDEQQILDKLKHRDINPTAMRMLVLKILMEQPYAISLADLEMLFDHADRTTLFRTLKLFKEHRLIHSIDDGTGSVKYALCEDRCDCSPEEVHMHFHCTGCKRTYCLTDIHMPELTVPLRFRLQDINIVMRGLCDQCSGKTS